MKKRMIGKGIVLGVILLFVGASFLPSISGNTTELDKKQIVKSQKQVNDQKEVLVTCYNFGLPGKPLKQIEMSQYEAEYLYEKIKELNYAVAEDPLRESTQQLQIEIIDLADEYDLLPTGLSKKLVKEKYIHVYKSQTNRIGSLTPKTQSKASAFFCNFAIAGTGSQTPVIILPRLIPIIQLPIPRIILRWNALDGIASCGGLRSGTGFIAMGQQTGTALGFWGIGFSIFLPPFMQYGFIGYALYASANAEIIELWPPNYPPEISHITPDNGEMNVSISLSELQFEISDFNGDRMSYTVTTTPDIGSGSGNLKSDGVYSVSISGLEDLTEYSWHIEVTDGMDTTTKDSSFTTEAIAPIVSNPDPYDDERNVPIDISYLSFHLKDFQGDPMDYTVETSTDIGSGYGTGVGDGIYIVNINGLDYYSKYTWYVNVTDGAHWTREVYTYKTRPMSGPWWDNDWQYRKELIINSAEVASHLNNFPVLVSIDNDNDLAAHAQYDGDDIAFTDYSGIKLNHEIELYEYYEGRLLAWVNVIDLTPETILYMYYGNPSSSNQENVEETWDSHHEAVWHMDDLTSSTIADSTSNHNDGTKKAPDQPGEISNAVVGKGQYINHKYITVPDPDESTEELTVMCWMKGTDGAPIAHFEYDSADERSWSFLETYQVTINSGTFSPLKNYYPNNNYYDNSWHLAVFTFIDNDLKLYNDGKIETVTKINDDVIHSLYDSNTVLTIGTFWREEGSGGPAHTFDGYIDEVRVSNCVRSADWILTAYNTMANQQSFFSFGPEEPVT